MAFVTLRSVIISENGYVLTCNHVVEGSSAVVVMLRDGTRYNAQMVGTDATTDLAVLKITPAENETLVAVVQGISGNLIAGETVVVIGNPLGSLGGTVTHGIISATERQISVSNSDGTVSFLPSADIFLAALVVLLIVIAALVIRLLCSGDKKK